MSDVGTCSICAVSLDEAGLFFAGPSDGGAARFCPRHAGQAGEERDSFLSVLGGARPVTRTGAALAAELARASEECASGRAEAEGLREKLVAAAAERPAEAGRGGGTLGLGVGDRSEGVMARSMETGSRVERQLVGRGGALRLTERGREGGVPLWSAAAGALVAAVGTVGTAAGLPFMLQLEGPHSEVQVWCRDAASLDEWLHWIKLHHPHAKITRNPPAPSSSPRSIPRPRSSSLSSRLGSVSSSSSSSLRPPIPGSPPANGQGSTMTLRQRFVKTKSRITVDSDSSGDDGASSATSVSSAPGTPPPSLSRSSVSSSSMDASPTTPLSESGHNTNHMGRKMFGWAKKLYDKAGDAVQQQRNSSAAAAAAAVAASAPSGKMLDVFVTSLQDVMAEQEQVFPSLKVPLIMIFLVDEIIRLNGHRTEGIFRISASHHDVAEVVQSIKKARNFDYKLPPIDDPHIPAAVMKQWLRELPVPVFQDYARCIEVTRLPSNSAEEREAYAQMVRDLSEVHRCVVIFLISFLTFVGEPANVPSTKMPLANLALVFVPSFLRYPGDNVAAMLTNQPAEQKFVQTLVEMGALGEFGPLLEFGKPAKSPTTSVDIPDANP